MKAALVHCPFFTNGDWPPLGLACIQGALKQAGHEVAGFDFTYLAYRDDFGLLHLLRQLFGLGRVTEDVPFVLRPDLVFYLLFKDRYPRFRWQISGEAEEKAAAAMLLLGLKRTMPDWAGRVLAGQPQAVFFSTYLTNLFLSLRLAQELRQERPELPIIFGGPGAGLAEVQELALRLGFPDAIVVGEGERTAPELAGHLPGRIPPELPGVATLQNDELQFRHRPLEKDLDALPRPDFEGLPLPGEALADYGRNRPNRFFTPYYHGFPISATRGCVNHCAYCSETAYWKRFRQRRAEAVVAEIQELHHRYGAAEFEFNDSAINGNPGWLKEFCRQVQRLEFEIIFSGYIIADRAVDAELAGLMFQAGFRHVSAGVETFSEAVRARMNKGMAAEDIFASLLLMTRAGINVKANILIGFPGETEADLAATFEIMARKRKLPPAELGPGRLIWDAGHPLRLEPFSELFRRPERFGIHLEPAPPLPLPDELGHFQPLLTRMLFSWRREPGPAELERRSEEMKQEAAKE